MATSEPFPTAVFLAVAGFLLIVSVVFSRATERFPVPVNLVFLVIGMLAGSQGLGGIPFEDYELAFRLGTIALALILFDGGLNTPGALVRRVAAPAAVLSTVGVVGTAALLALGARALGLGWPEALLVGAVTSSTDAAAVFAVLRGSGVHLRRRVAATLEVESGSNDPMAVILTMAVTAALVVPGNGFGSQAFTGIALQIAVGTVGGLAVGYGARALLGVVRTPSAGLQAVLVVGVACLAFALPTLARGSGFLAVYLAGIVLGNAELPHKTGLLRVHDALAWLSQVTMFLVLGLLVFPARLLEVAPVGLGLAALLTFVARPLVVWPCLVGFGYPAREIAYIAAVGLRGAVPIVLASFPVLAGAPGAGHVFDLVFFVVVTSAFVPGALVPWLATRLRVERSEPPAPPAVLTIESLEPLSGEILSFYVDPALPVAGARVSELPFPPGAAIVMIVRGRDLVAPHPDTVLRPGDHAYVIASPADRAFVQLLLGRPEEP